MLRRTLNILDMDYDTSEVWYSTCDGENRVCKLVFNTQELDEWLTINGYCDQPFSSFTEKWIEGRAIPDIAMIRFLREQMPEFSFTSEMPVLH